MPSSALGSSEDTVGNSTSRRAHGYGKDHTALQDCDSNPGLKLYTLSQLGGWSGVNCEACGADWQDTGWGTQETPDAGRIEWSEPSN
jgi:hypothetical protein